MTAPKFSKGDRVRLLVYGYGRLPAGSVGTVMEDHVVPNIAWDGYTGGYDGGRGDGSTNCRSVHEDRLELLPASDDDAARALLRSAGR